MQRHKPNVNAKVYKLAPMVVVYSEGKNITETGRSQVFGYFGQPISDRMNFGP